MASPSREQVWGAVDRILSSREFTLCGRLSRFLQTVVEKKLAGKTHEIKEVVIGVEVFGKEPGYDPKLEPIVRVEAHRLRNKLERYYANSGKLDPVKIDLPKGAYVPVFSFFNGVNAKTPKPAWRPPRLFIAGFVAAALITVGLAWQFVSLRRLSRAVQPLTPVPITTYPGVECSPSFSPDGDRIAFQWANPARGIDDDIWVKDVRGESLQRLTSDPRSDFGPSWSPDGATIAFLRDIGDSKAEIRLISPDEGAAERLLATTWVQKADLAMADTYLAWTPNSAALIAPGRESGEAGLFLFRLAGGSSRRITAAGDGQTVDRSPSVSPDGRTLAFTRALDWSRRQICTAPLNAGMTPPKADCSAMQAEGVYTPVWTGHGREFVLARGPKTGASLWRADRSDLRRQIRLNLADRSAIQPTISPRGDRLAYVRLNLDIEIWKFPLENGVAAAERGRKWIERSGWEHSPAYSPDGRRVAFQSNWAGTAEIWIASPDGHDPRRLTFLSVRYVGIPVWSPDGSQIAFAAMIGTDWELLVTPANGDGPPVKIAGLNGNTVPEWTRDGKALLAVSTVGGRAGVFRFPAAAGGDPAPAVEGAVGGAQLSPDGRFLYFLPNRLERLRRRDLASGDETDATATPVASQFRLGRKGVYFFSSADPRGELMFQPFGSRAAKRVLSGATTHSFAVSPDEKTLLAVMPGSASSDLMLVEPFR